MKLAKRRLASTALVTLLGIGVFWWGTYGLAAFTAETARRADILRSPWPEPDPLPGCLKKKV